jgi:cytoskeletal protein CcmA (bactofilin family)
VQLFKFGNKINKINSNNMTIVNKSETPSILSKGFQMQGDILSSGVLEIEGKVKGLIKGSSIVIREGGLVDGRIDSDCVSVYGSFSGDIKANNINIFKKAKIVGNIEYKCLSVEDGASIDGQFKRINVHSGAKDTKDSNTANKNKDHVAKPKVA